MIERVMVWYSSSSLLLSLSEEEGEEEKAGSEDGKAGVRICKWRHPSGALGEGGWLACRAMRG